MLHKYFSITLLALFTLTLSAHAQGIPGTGQPDPVQYVVASETPGPNETVYIEVNGVGSFLGNATITWSKDGTVVSSGVGQSTYSFTTGGIGQPTRIRVTINSATQGTITHEFIFNPSVVNMLWEADTTTPLMYTGKPLYSAGSRLAVFAYPTILIGGSLVPSNKLSFQWSHNDTKDTSQSGTGKYFYTFDGDQLLTEEHVTVDVYYSGIKVGRGDITIPAVSPQIISYVRDPLRGELLDTALPSAVSVSKKEFTIQAEPYYFSKQAQQRGELQFSWDLNGNDATGPDASRGILTLRQTSNTPGAAQLTVSVQNTNIEAFVQAASQTLQIMLGQQAGSALSSFFGL